MRMLAIECLLGLACFGAAQTAESRPFNMLGSYDCALWPVNHDYAVGWFMGYLTATNDLEVEAGKPDLLQGTSGPELSGWMENYCRVHPKENWYQALQQLVDELRRRAKSRP